ncbi:leucine-rich_repeat domain-containing protein [Hexamita inflata]|uniref:Leucine-rich repeat domain-containing protein n=1 Tax=Hexamita inflata TaxID=28002 RepID=A0AA86QE15_9EUKA|nr:leucine-rich repeat domain-containing protein [Hexamita inflata]
MIIQNNEMLKVLSNEEEIQYDKQMILKYKNNSKSILRICDDQQLISLKFVESFNDMPHKDSYFLEIQQCYKVLFTRFPVNIYRISVNSCNLQNFEGLGQMQHLVYFRSDKNQNLQDISEIKFLVNLTDLELNRNQIINISPLKYLINIVGLSLIGNRIRDIEPLSNLINLEKLFLRDNIIVNIYPLAKLQNLEVLDLSYNPIVYIKTLEQLTKLIELNISQTLTLDLSPIQVLKKHSVYKRVEYKMNDLEQPTKEQIFMSIKFDRFYYLEELTKKLKIKEEKFQNKMKKFNKRILKRYNAAIKSQKIFWEIIKHLFEYMNTGEQ